IASRGLVRPPNTSSKLGHGTAGAALPPSRSFRKFPWCSRQFGRNSPTPTPRGKRFEIPKSSRGSAGAVGDEREADMSYLLPHLHSGWAVDQAILAEEERLVIIRFGHDWDETCMQVRMDEVLSGVAETIKNFAVIYLVDITEVPDFNTMYELYDPSTVMFFFRNKHIMIDLGTGNNNKINWAMKDKQEFVDIVETVYRGARKGRGLVIAPKDYSTKYRY
uniref:Thioredoxin-like protein 4A n=1 Tax=Aegilops tauschii subsp. strangulata TaxID=200361 RepID=A0A452YHF8_AEGTS